ncbi:hypothetical protein TNCV_3816181 [Trichonephila clavipes]|nr:hypothetical protein TNCV_3816181 [Trichonephila clavipes]
MLIVAPLGLGSNPEEDMGVCFCIVPSRHGGTLNSSRAASPIVRLVEKEARVYWGQNGNSFQPTREEKRDIQLRNLLNSRSLANAGWL